MISTDNISGGGSGKLPKIIQPGNAKIKFYGMSIDTTPSQWTPGALNIVLEAETTKIEGFEGFFIDKGNESLGRHDGQVGRINAGRWPFNDFDNDTISIKRDDTILYFVKNLCDAADCNDWLVDQNNKHETVESLLEQMIADKPFADKWLDASISGREYQNNGGYINHALFFEKFTKSQVPFETMDKDSGKLYTFDSVKHIVKLKTKDVEEFSENMKTPESASAGDRNFDI